MSTSPKKSSSKRGAAVRDITVKRVTQTPEEDAFQVRHIQDESHDLPSVEPLISTSPLRDEVENLEEEVESALASMADDVPEKEQVLSSEQEPKDIVRVRFSKFVQLVSSRDCSDVVNANPDEDVIISSNLLTELAGSHDDREEKKIPLVFLVGLAIGVVLTYILITK